MAQRSLSSFIVMAKGENSVSSNPESITEPATENVQVEKCTFEHSLNDQQIDSLVDGVNEVRMFKGGDVTFEQLKAIFDCLPITPLRSSNNRLLAFFFDQLSNHSYIAEKWQSAIYKNNLFLSPQKDSFVNYCCPVKHFKCHLQSFKYYFPKATFVGTDTTEILTTHGFDIAINRSFANSDIICQVSS